VSGVIRLGHPFPTLLDGLATAAIALIAGGSPAIAIRLGLAMVGIQAGIGAVNDIVDSDRDRESKPGKPLPRGVVSVATARLVAVVAIAWGLALSLPSGPAVIAVALVGLAVGLAYNLWLKGTAWSWLPFALGIPLLPVYAWLGARGDVPASFALLVPAAVGAGAALAIANAIADADRDRDTGVGSVAVTLGTEGAWRIHAVLQVLVFAVALASLALAQGTVLPLTAVAGGGLLVALGAALCRSSRASRRERGWELEAIGIGVAAIGWFAGIGSYG
jgi:4-hydroxybenzoate polyprenyltransferase